jgi:hypothetical protein
MDHCGTPFAVHDPEVPGPHPDVRQALFQVRNLLSEAAAVLHARFVSIQSLSQRHVDLTRRAMAGPRCGAARLPAATGAAFAHVEAVDAEDDAQSLALIVDEYQRHAAVVVGTLQSQALAASLLEQAMRRLAGPDDDTVTQPRNTGHGLAIATHPDRAARPFDPARRLVRSPVSSVHACTGDIELF